MRETPLQIYFYNRVFIAPGLQVRDIIEGLQPPPLISASDSIENLLYDLRQPIAAGIRIGVLLIGNEGEMQEILAIRPMLTDLDLIVVLPDRQVETISMGLKLFPSFLTYIDGNLADISGVLTKIIAKYPGASEADRGMPT
jgi:hypothetical protein